MDWIITPYVMVSAFAAVLAGSVALLASRRLSQPGGRSLTGLMLSTAAWSGFTALEYAAVGIPAKVFWARLEYVGVVSTPVMFLMLALEYNRSERWLTRRNVALLFSLPLITWLLALTNDWHWILWTSYSLGVAGSNLVVYGHGAWFWVVVIGYSYLLMAAGTVLLIRAAFRYPPAYRSQTVAMIIGVLVPWAGNALYITQIGVVPGFDPTALLISITGIFFAWGIFRLRLLDLVPVARQTVIESMRDAMFVLDVQDRVVDLNLAARELLGPSPKEPIGRSLDQVLGEYPAALEAIRGREGVRSEFALNLQGEERHFSLRISPLTDVRGRQTGRVIVLADITVIQQAQEAVQRAALLEEREHMAQELHDNLGQVLSYLSLNAQAIREQVEQGNYAAAQGQLEALSLAAQGASRDVREYILDVKTQAEEAQKFSDVLRLYLVRYEAITGVHTLLSLPEESIDAALSEQAYVNLLRVIQESLANARKHAHASQAQIIFSLAAEYLQVLIVDNGTGFEVAAAKAGFGLGIMQERASKAGAELEIRSAPGQGTQVMLKFPRLQADLVRTRLGGVRVVLVDDHPLFVEGLKNLLLGRGLVVVGVATGAEGAVRMAGEHKPDLLLLDMHMPGGSGVQAVRPILEVSPATRVVMLSMSADDDELAQTLNLGACGYLLKSQPPDELFQALMAIQRGETPLAPGLANGLANRLAARLAQPALSREAQAAQDLQSAGLSPQQVEILRGVAEGKLYKEIAAELHISEGAVKYHMERIQNLLGVTNRSEAVAYAFKLGLAQDRRNTP